MEHVCGHDPRCGPGGDDLGEKGTARCGFHVVDGRVVAKLVSGAATRVEFGEASSVQLVYENAMVAQLLILLFCVLWLVICWRIWLVVGRQHAWQRHLIAIGAGGGAALFYIIGTLIWSAVKPVPKPMLPPADASEAVRVAPRVK